ncbi:2-succinyl-5-enolpyruvyl-6-hydroxy-3-cyclohexene-1-carboxylic-acid synthase [Flavivirga aquatica]|uniref:2-succinyl-5-enolpyruvyl-6-hydroxy-3-cyclohexene-1-carboxylate synthase n=1 Tax=Flavivirga aquatica TaxID=1849968 RepID=A0A1E5TAB6_9FLAO|nr:2-succinyl-5-enolpyruvyl-6-hydroxy-3-cyclohexene-1-carboxylic-acid synthase [Flavivirga aquatica]OEK08319.1 2-succinyl-5-enolpyruvyl-6-hydroxy-3-cyclohexene-1-carboxylic-acid synthase [Flavivirga aquatica]
MIYPKIPLAQTVIQLCEAKGIKHIILSPGSRNAPLTIGFTNNAYFKCYSIVDERCAAFFALGIAQQLQEPTAVVCTSGSALLNYYPAIAEAFYSNIPLVVLSADRPKHLIGVGDGQTINQKNVFENHILYSTNLKLDLKETDGEIEEELPIFKNIENKLENLLGLKQGIQEFNELEINKAINVSVLKQGPVHINIPFDEPLYETVDELYVNPKVIEVDSPFIGIEPSVFDACIESWNASSKKMILVGVNYPNQINEEWLNVLAKDESIVVFTETTSNLHHDSFFPSIDQIIAPLTIEEQQDLQPDILITFGGLIVSKKIKILLRKYKPNQHWHIDKNKANDTFFSLKHHIKSTPNQFFEAFFLKVPNAIKSNYKSTWSSVKAKRIHKHQDYINQIPFSDFVVFNSLLKSIPNNYTLQVSNSSAIRYTQLFSLNNTLKVFCNRGTSGIDGSTSTAIGSAVVNTKPTLLITGDLSFLYDSNALWNNHLPKSFRIIVINNQGGGIFRILPGHKNTENFDTYFETNHNYTAEHLCKMYNFKYECVSNGNELDETLQSFYVKGDQPKLLEVFTPKEVNDEVLLNYFKFIK